MQADTNVHHKGIVKSIDDDTVKVFVQSQSLCASCHAKKSCTMLDIKEKLIEASSFDEKFSPGENVIVQCRESTGLQAVWWAYILPFIVLMTTLIVIFYITKNELLVGLSSVLILIPYYLLLRAFKHKLKKKFTFSIQKIVTNE